MKSKEMHFLFCSFATAFAFVITSTQAQSYVTPPPRRSPSCALLNRKIHCFGGYTGPNNAMARDTSFYTLDISNVTDNFATKWEQITDAMNSNIATNQPRGRPQVAATSDGKNMIISGGIPWSSNSTTPQHLVYNADAKSWTSLADFDDSPNGNFRQIYLATATYIPDQSKFYFYGGVENYPAYSWYLDSVTGVNITNPIFTSDTTKSKIGYYRMATLDIDSTATNPWQVLTQQNPLTVDYYMQSSVYHTTSKKIYYFGGYYNDINAIGTANLTFREAIVFNTATATWGKQAFTGGVIPTVRRYHTMTLLPSGQDVLLYGGTTNDANPSRDFCFIGNLETFVWTSCNTIGLPDNGITYRAEHSAVLDEAKKIVYILFGYASDKSVVDNYATVLALNVSDPKAVSFVESTQQIQPVETQLPTNTGNEENSSGGNGATLGGAIGGAVGGVLVIGLIAFFVIKKKKNGKNTSDDDKEEQLSVDWDAIEGGYKETYPVSRVNTKDMAINLSKPYEPSVQEKEAMLQFSPALTNTNTETTAVAPVCIPDVAVQQQDNGNAVYSNSGRRGDLITKPDVAID